MTASFLPYDQHQQMLLPHALQDWLPEGHLAYFISDTVDSLDLSAFHARYAGGGPRNQPFNPAMMVKVLVYGYATGVFSSRKLARKLHEDVALRMLAADNYPAHRTICDFRAFHLKELSDLFVQVVKMAKECGLVKLGMIGVDGTKIKANASRHKAMSYERMQKAERELKEQIDAFKVRGPVVGQMQSAFIDNWMQATGEVLHGEIYLPALTPAGTHSARVFTSFSASYFVPDTVAVNSLIAAVARGVKVRIIVPEKYQDWEVVRRASRTAWGRLLQGGVELYEYQPSFDARSFSINDEANLNICDAGFAERQAAIFRSDLERSRRITFAEWEARPWSDKALDFGASLLASQLQSSRCRLQFRLASTISTQCRRAGFATSWPRRCRSPAA